MTVKSLTLALLLSGSLALGQGPSLPVGMRLGTGLPSGSCILGQLYFQTDVPVAGSGRFQCGPTGWFSSTIHGATTLLWDDLRTPVTALAPGSTACNIVVFGPAGSVRSRDCNPGEDMDGAAELGGSYAEGTDIHPHVHWSPINNNAGNVRWGFDYYWLNEGDTAGGAPTTILTPDQATGGVAWKTNVVHFPVITGTGKKISSILMFRVYRTNASAGEYGSRAVLLSMDVHFQIDSLGSQDEDVK